MKYLLNYFNDTQYRTLPHFVTFFDKKNLKTKITNAPIFTTIDNGCLKINLSLEAVHTARNFMPTPDQSLSSDEYITYFDTPQNPKVISYEEMKKLNKNKEPEKHQVFDKTYIVEHKENEEYFYQYGKAYFNVSLKTEEIESTSDESSNSEGSKSEQDETPSDSEQSSAFGSD